MGVVFLPSENALYFARQNKGAWLITDFNAPPEPLRVSDKSDFAGKSLASNRNHHSPHMTAVLEKLCITNELRRDSVGLKVGLIARRICDLYIHPSSRTKHWDTCAPEVILRESGGEMTNIFGERIVYNTSDVQNRNGILASNGIYHFLAVKNLKSLSSLSLD